MKMMLIEIEWMEMERTTGELCILLGARMSPVRELFFVS